MATATLNQGVGYGIVLGLGALFAFGKLVCAWETSACHSDTSWGQA